MHRKRLPVTENYNLALSDVVTQYHETQVLKNTDIDDARAERCKGQ